MDEGRAVPGYRLYFHDDEGHFMRANEIEAPDDDAARQAALELDHANCVEIWSGKRKVGIVEPAGARDNLRIKTH